MGERRGETLCHHAMETQNGPTRLHEEDTGAEESGVHADLRSTQGGMQGHQQGDSPTLAYLSEDGSVDEDKSDLLEVIGTCLGALDIVKRRKHTHRGSETLSDLLESKRARLEGVGELPASLSSRDGTG